jgi:pre-rRNA-processing protein TSR1
MNIATVFAPIQFPPQNVLIFQRNGIFQVISQFNLEDDSNSIDLVAKGSLLRADPKRIILKKILLTGYPFKNHKKKAIVRYMFFNPTDVHYFKPIKLQTKFGLRVNLNISKRL